jgi:hypothetical protein
MPKGGCATALRFPGLAGHVLRVRPSGTEGGWEGRDGPSITRQDADQQACVDPKMAMPPATSAPFLERGHEVEVVEEVDEPVGVEVRF